VAATVVADGSFGMRGLLALSPFGQGAFNDVPGGVASASDGAILSVDPADGFAVWRVTPQGRVDASFGRGGEVRLFDADQAAATAVDVDRHGRVLIAGRRSDGAVLVVRVDAAGRLDSAFGHGGQVILPVPSTKPGPEEMFPDRVSRVLALPDGIALLTANFVVARLTADGAAAPGFGSGGMTRLPVPPIPLGEFTGAQAVDMQAQRSGALVILEASNGASEHGSAYFSRLTRLTTGGNVDSTFASDLPATDVPVAQILIQRDDKLVVAGGDGSRAMLQRLWPDGRRDASFGRRSGLGRSVPGSANLPYDTVNQVIDPPVGVIDDNLSRYYVLGDFLARFDRWGRPDVAFGDCGKAAFSSRAFVTHPRAILRRPNGRLIVIGFNDVSIAGYGPLGLQVLAVASVQHSHPHGRPALESTDFADANGGLILPSRASLAQRGLSHHILSPESATATGSLIATHPIPGIRRLLARGVANVRPCRSTRLTLRATAAGRRTLLHYRRRSVLDLTLRLTLRNQAGTSSYDANDEL
jgi:uncharacterized delta-60 repeat protein